MITLYPIQIEKTTVTAQSRCLDAKWFMIWPRYPQPQNINWHEFPHDVTLTHDSLNQVEAWLHNNVGELDKLWTYQNSGTVMFKHHAHAIQFKLTFG